MAVDLIPADFLFTRTLAKTPEILLSLVWDPHKPPRPIPPGELDAVRTALIRIYKQWSQGPNWVSLVTIIGTGFSQVVDEQYEISRFRYLATAFGATLDELGALVGLDRQDLDEELYRRAIRARGASTIGDAGIDAVMLPAKVILGENGVTYAPSYPRAYCYILNVPVTQQILDLLVRLLTPLPGCGIGAKLVLSPPEAPGWDWTTAQAWAASWSSVYGAVDLSVASPWGWTVQL